MKRQLLAVALAALTLLATMASPSAADSSPPSEWKSTVRIHSAKTGLCIAAQKHTAPDTQYPVSNQNGDWVKMKGCDGSAYITSFQIGKVGGGSGFQLRSTHPGEKCLGVKPDTLEVHLWQCVNWKGTVNQSQVWYQLNKTTSGWRIWNSKYRKCLSVGWGEATPKLETCDHGIDKYFGFTYL